MTRFAHRIGAVVLTLGALVLTPAISLAENFEPSVDGHRIYQGEGLSRVDDAGYAEVDTSGHRKYRGEGLPRINVALDYARYQGVDGPSMQPSYHDAGEPWLGNGAWPDAEITAFPVGDVDTAFEQMKQLFGTDLVTQEMIGYYEDNVWEFEGYADFATQDDHLLPGADDVGRNPAGRFDY